MPHLLPQFPQRRRTRCRAETASPAHQQNQSGRVDRKRLRVWGRRLIGSKVHKAGLGKLGKFVQEVAERINRGSRWPWFRGSPLLTWTCILSKRSLAGAQLGTEALARCGGLCLHHLLRPGQSSTAPYNLSSQLAQTSPPDRHHSLGRHQPASSSSLVFRLWHWSRRNWFLILVALFDYLLSNFGKL